ncbi:hypothetical protein BABINDRAFT_177685 [Babjeviella inositovora NRRL Y-12698]|uniref:D-arabinono-1,4-lactone oxidase n=1 Tax=Babjeviella inositovora NRRL Y-12698 TaxID=984486 RepID=A0A1E3QKF2_9ASCO|nr:uncharacterized protein BABINDRAFT_177685 [Babjeviella inositovora NRRL Y-12698]ODQ78098.1 hypothetical protein BABINDRAFT_177685 [Babjeviella inositovora NRRL Y-12698]
MSVPKSIAHLQVSKLIHSTWAGTFQCRPSAYFQPATLDDIKTLVNEARLNKKTLMTVGSGHSPSDLTMTSEWLVNLDKFHEILEIKPHASGKFTDITVEAGVRIFQLNEFLKTKNLAIQNLGSISDQSIAGIISTGTHGSSQYHGLVSSQVVDLSLVNSAGELVKCSPTENREIFQAALLSLGKIGLITHVTLRTIPRYQIKSKQEVINFDTLLKNWDTIFTTDEFIRCWWFPYTEKCILWRASKTQEPLSAPRASWYGTTLGRLFYESLLWVSVHVAPRLTPYVERFVFQRQYGNVETLGKGDIAVQGSVEGLNMDCLFSQFVNEWLAPLTDGVAILTQLDAVIKAAAAKGEFFVHAPMEVRCSNTTINPVVEENFEEFLAQREMIAPGPIPGNFVKPFMDATPRNLPVTSGEITNEQLTLYINATMYRPFHTDIDVGPWYEKFERVLLDYQGKPHWAKNFIGHSISQEQDLASRDVQLKYGGRDDGKMYGFQGVMKDWFGEDLKAFKRVREQVDKDGVFLANRDWAIRNGIVDK